MFRYLLLCFGMVLMCGSAFAEPVKRYASIVVDTDTLEIIHARQIDGQRFPASLTKVMTLYLTFDAINSGQITLDEPLKVSRRAAATPPVGLGLRKGQTITVEQAIQALTVRSANDAASVLAERIAGSEEAFAAQMTARAKTLGMQQTQFMTPHGLPHPDQTTTARDMAKLAAAMLNHHRRYYHYFGQENFTWKKRTYRNSNNLLHWLPGVDGFKTGFTNDSGYNLIISAERENRRIIAVVLGGASGTSRDRHMQDLIERSFKVIGIGSAAPRAPIIVREEQPPQVRPVTQASATAVRLRGRNDAPLTVISGGQTIKIASMQHDISWSVQTGAFTDEASAKVQLAQLSMSPRDGLSHERALVVPVTHSGQTLFRARFTGMTAQQAQHACAILQNAGSPCQVIAPGGR